MKFLIAGLGSIGRRHLKNLLALGERDISLYRTYRGSLPDDEFNDFPVETNLQSALSKYPDAVIVSNPTALHLDVAIKAAEAGCHLLLEKPISHTAHGIDELQTAVKSNGVEVLTGFQFRFHPGLNKIAEIIDNGDLGRSISVRAHWGEYLPGWHPWEDYREGYSARKELGGGVVLTLCHPLDYLRMLFGEVQALWAFCGKLGNLGIDVEDTAEIGLKFINGIFGSVHLDYNQRPSSHHLEIVGTHGTLRWDNATGAVERFDPEREVWDIYPPPPDFDRNQMFLMEMKHFLDVISGVDKPVCSLEDGIRALKLALAVYESCETKKLISFET
jgi:predicted dehydrogenase